MAFTPIRRAHGLGTERLADEGEHERLGDAHDRERHVDIAGLDHVAAGTRHAQAEVRRVGPLQRRVHGRQRALDVVAESAVRVLDEVAAAHDVGQRTGRHEASGGSSSQNFQITGTQNTAITKNHTSTGSPIFQ